MLHLGEVRQLLLRGGQLPLGLLGALGRARQLALQGCDLVSALARLALRLECPGHGVGRICKVGITCCLACAIALCACERNAAKSEENEEENAARKRKKTMEAAACDGLVTHGSNACGESARSKVTSKKGSSIKTQRPTHLVV